MIVLTESFLVETYRPLVIATFGVAISTKPDNCILFPLAWTSSSTLRRSKAPMTILRLVCGRSFTVSSCEIGSSHLWAVLVPKLLNFMFRAAMFACQRFCYTIQFKAKFTVVLLVVSHGPLHCLDVLMPWACVWVFKVATVMKCLTTSRCVLVMSKLPELCDRWISPSLSSSPNRTFFVLIVVRRTAEVQRVNANL